MAASFSPSATCSWKNASCSSGLDGGTSPWMIFNASRSSYRPQAGCANNEPSEVYRGEVSPSASASNPLIGNPPSSSAPSQLLIWLPPQPESSYAVYLYRILSVTYSRRDRSRTDPLSEIRVVPSLIIEVDDITNDTGHGCCGCDRSDLTRIPKRHAVKLGNLWVDTV